MRGDTMSWGILSGLLALVILFAVAIYHIDISTIAEKKYPNVLYNTEPDKDIYTRTRVLTSTGSSGMEILTLDDCEYVIIRRSNGVGITHKGNCINRNQH